MVKIAGRELLHISSICKRNTQWLHTELTGLYSIYRVGACVPKSLVHHRNYYMRDNKISPTRNDWSYKPKEDEKPKFIKKKGKLKKNRGKKKQKRQKITKHSSDKFYGSREWAELRVRVLEKYECKCMMCGRSPRDHNIVIHVDHIKPRRDHPELALEFSNMQLLCSSCNYGKGNKYKTDWRPKEEYVSDCLDEDHLDSISHLI